MKLQYDENEFKTSISNSDVIFHYTRRSLALEKILYGNCFKFSFFSMTNDPYEYKNKIVGVAGWGWDTDVEKKIHESKRLLDKLLISQTLFISFCENEIKNNDLINHGFLKSRMWSQYGENHEGICLIFSKEKIIEKLKTLKCKENILWHQKVEYVEYVNDHSHHQIMSIDSNSFDHAPPKDIAINHLIKNYKTLLFRKQSDYRDEQEYRFVILSNNNILESSSIPQFEVKSCLIGVILGDRFPKVYFPSIKNLCDNLDVKCKKLHWEAGHYILRNLNYSERS